MEGSEQQASRSFTDSPAEEEQKGDGLKHFLDAPKEALLETERTFLTKALEFLKVPPLTDYFSGGVQCLLTGIKRESAFLATLSTCKLGNSAGCLDMDEISEAC